MTRFSLFFRSVKLCIAAGILMAIFIFLPGLVNPARAQSGEHVVTGFAGAAATVHAQGRDQPPLLSAVDRARLESAQAHTHLRGLGTRNRVGGVSPLVEPKSSATRPQVLTGAAGQDGMLASSSTFVFSLNNDLGSGAPAGYTSVVGEPSVGNTGNSMLQTGNWYAAVSNDSGATFSFVNPYTTFPSAYSGFCCDQHVLYDPSRDLVFWLLLYSNDSVGNILRVASAHGQAGLESLSFQYRDFSPQAIGFPAGDWYDYPNLALSNNYLYVSLNVFKSDNATFDGTVVLRLSLDSLAAGGPFAYDSYQMDKSLYFNATLTLGATTTMYWATHADNATMRLYQWPEGGAVSATNVAHSPYPTTANYVCLGPNGRDWCGRLDDRVLSGWVSNGLIGFMWNGPQGTANATTFNYPFIQMMLVNQGALTLAGQSYMSSPNYAFAYAAAAVNARGHVAGSVFLGGGAIYPTLAAFIWDDLSPVPYPTPPSAWEMYTAAASSQGPDLNRWGDYLAARQNHAGTGYQNLWLATGYTLVGGGGNNNARPRVLSFGRERDLAHGILLPFIAK